MYLKLHSIFFKELYRSDEIWYHIAGNPFTDNRGIDENATQEIASSEDL